MIECFDFSTAHYFGNVLAEQFRLRHRVFVQRARDQGLTITHIINTHGHEDHTNGNARAAELTYAQSGHGA